MKWSSIPLAISLLACGKQTVLKAQHEALGPLEGRSTYAFAVAPAAGLTEQGFTTGHLFNPIMKRRVEDELTRELALRGYSESPAEKASLLVTFAGGQRQDVVTEGNQTGPVVQGPAYAVDRGALMLLFIDPQSKAVLWRGWGDGVMDPDEDLDLRVRTAVREIMAAFPKAQS